jgi:hypothetical protein
MYCAESGLSFPEQEASAMRMAAITRNGKKFFLLMIFSVSV